MEAVEAMVVTEASAADPRVRCFLEVAVVSGPEEVDHRVLEVVKAAAVAGGGAGGGTMEARGNRGVVDSGPRVWKNRVQFPAGLNAENCPNYPYCVYSPSP